MSRVATNISMFATLLSLAIFVSVEYGSKSLLHGGVRHSEQFSTWTADPGVSVGLR